MNSRAIRSVGIFLAGMATAGMFAELANAQLGKRHEVKPLPLKHVVVHKHDLADLKGKQAAVVEVEYAPGASDKKHYHSGHLFTYVIEGSVVWEVEGQPPVTLKAGDAFYDPPKRVHNHRNASATNPAKFVAFFIEDKGQKRSVPVK